MYQLRSAPDRARETYRSTRPLSATILGTGASVPDRILGNAFFENELGLETSSEWIERRIGILERRWADGESSTELAVDAARFALSEASLDPLDVDLVIVATSTPEFTMPSTACLVQSRLGARHAAAFDVVNACAGFVYAFDAAVRYLQFGDIRNAVVVGVDLGSRLVNPRDRTTSVFFGDGAGAVVLGSGGDGSVLATKLGSRGTSEPLSVPFGGTMAMDGKAVWDFATEVLPSTIRDLCTQAGTEVNDIRLIVPHQANRNILAAAASDLGLSLDRFAINIDRYGNTVAASVPIALHEALSADRASEGDLVALVGFGAGLAWGGQLLRL